MADIDHAGAGDGADRLSRRRQDHLAQPHPDREPRPQIRRGDQRVRRTRRRQRPRRGQRRGSVRDEQRLHLLHRARRPDPHRRRPDEAARQVRRHHHRDHRPGEPGPGGADLLRRRQRQGEDPAGRDRHGGRRQASAGPPGRQPRGGRPDRLRRRHRAEQDRPGDAGGTGRGRGHDPRHQPLRHHPPHPARRRCRSRRCWTAARSTCSASWRCIRISSTATTTTSTTRMSPR